MDNRESSRDAMVYKQYQMKIEPLKDRLVRFIITTSAPDRERDVVDVNGIDTTAYEANPVVLFGHDYRSLPIGRCVKLQRQAKQILATTEFATADLNPMAEQVYRMVKAGFLKAASIGFRPLESRYNEVRRGTDFLRCELLEWSVVPVPANPQALVALRAAGIDMGVMKSWAQHTLDHMADDDEIVLRLIDDAPSAAGSEAAVKHAIHESLVDIIRSETSHGHDPHRYAEQDDERIHISKEEIAAVVRASMRESVNDAIQLAFNQLRGRID